ncbi:unnamed protein product, partial [Discosporangium mesarthrocarpum]
MPQAIWSSPVIPVPKPGWRGFQLVTDISAVNSRTNTCPFHTPNAEARMTALSHAGYFAKLDLFKGYWKFPLSQASHEIYTMVTGGCLFSLT